jgi:hypothetical protein
MVAKKKTVALFINTMTQLKWQIVVYWNFQHAIGITEVNNPSKSFSKYLHIITILIYGPQRIRMFWFPSQEPIGPWCGSFTKHIPNFDNKEEDNEMYIPSRNNIAP